MGAFSDNFYSWLDRQNAAEKAAMDEGVGYKHPDGTPCKAKKQENCPFYKKDMKESVEIDDLKTPSEVSKVETIATPEEMEDIEKGGNPNHEKFENVKPEDLATMSEGSTNSRYRKKRNDEFRRLVSEGRGGTFNLENPDAPIDPPLTSGYMVTFQTTNGEGFDMSNDSLFISDEQYDKKVDEWKKKSGGRAFLGVFGDIPEISFCVEDLKTAIKLAEENNQIAIWDVAMGLEAEKASKEHMPEEYVNALYDRAQIATRHDWKKNQTIKVKGEAK